MTMLTGTRSPHAGADALGAATWEIVPVRLGTMTVPTSQLLRGRRPGERMQVPCIAWIVRNGDEVIVVDTGPAGAVWSRLHHNPMVRPKEEGVVEAFAAAGVDVATVSTVVNTHLHWDHCYGNAYFTSARFYVQGRELDYADGPLPCDAPIYESRTVAPFRAMADRFVLVDGELELRPGVTLVPTPGHSPGHQGVLVQGAEHRMFIAGDAIGLAENLDGEGLPGTLYTDLAAWYETAATIRAIADVVLPGHDERVFEQAVYS